MNARRAFTVIELTLAMMLAAMVVSIALSLFWALMSADQRLAAKFADTTELAIAQRTVRRAMGSLVASKPKEPEPTAPASELADENAPQPDLEGEAGAKEDLANLITSVTGDEGLAAELTSGVGQDRPTFELFYEASSDAPLPSLEVRVMESLVPGNMAGAASVEKFLPVRGVFEVIQLPNELVLQWREIDPPAPPYVIARDLSAVEWYVLPRSRHGKMWADVYAAYLQEYYPVAVRLLIWTNSGTHADWLFDTAVTTPDAAQ